MKQKILFIIAVTMAATSCKKGILTPPPAPPESPVSKAIEFRVAQALDYSALAYDSVQAEVRLAVAKENLQNGTNTLLWDTTFSMRSLRQYPAFNAPFTVVKQFNGIIESREAHLA